MLPQGKRADDGSARFGDEDVFRLHTAQSPVGKVVFVVHGGELVAGVFAVEKGDDICPIGGGGTADGAGSDKGGLLPA